MNDHKQNRNVSSLSLKSIANMTKVWRALMWLYQNNNLYASFPACLLYPHSAKEKGTRSKGKFSQCSFK